MELSLKNLALNSNLEVYFDLLSNENAQKLFHGIHISSVYLDYY